MKIRIFGYQCLETCFFLAVLIFALILICLLASKVIISFVGEEIIRSFH